MLNHPGYRLEYEWNSTHSDLNPDEIPKFQIYFSSNKYTDSSFPHIIKMEADLQGVLPTPACLTYNL